MSLCFMWICGFAGEFLSDQVPYGFAGMGLLLVWGRNSNPKLNSFFLYKVATKPPSQDLQQCHRSLEKPSECITLSYICEFEFMWICSLRSGTLWVCWYGVCWWVCVYVNLCSVLVLLVFSLSFLWGTSSSPRGFFIHTSLATSSNSSLVD